jgi:4,5-DOPA dioxygenase extradiol
MTSRMPVVFISHGAPDALLKAPDTVGCWREIARHIPKPKGILVVSAHWEASVPTVSLAAAPATIHDFSGFSPELHQMQYPAPGAPALAERTMLLLSTAEIPAALHPNRGLDHGAWVPLSVIFSQAQVPVTQLSLTRQGTAAHFALGQALAPLREEGILIVASGAITHNFGWLDWHARNISQPLPKALAFADWVGKQLVAQNIPALLGYRTALYGAEAHPSEDHILPLFVALGVAGDERPEQYRPAFTYGGLAMDAYVWGHQKQFSIGSGVCSQ